MKGGGTTRASSAGDCFLTPPDVCRMIYAFFGDGELGRTPDVDPCGNPSQFLSAREVWCAGGLQREWITAKRRSVFGNPPYSRLEAWVCKAYEEHVAALEAARDHDILMLTPASTSARWWKDYAGHAQGHVFTKRLTFADANGRDLSKGEKRKERGTGNARFHSALYLFTSDLEHVGRLHAAFADIATWCVPRPVRANLYAVGGGIVELQRAGQLASDETYETIPGDELARRLP